MSGWRERLGRALRSEKARLELRLKYRQGLNDIDRDIMVRRVEEIDRKLQALSLHVSKRRGLLGWLRGRA